MQGEHREERIKLTYPDTFSENLAFELVLKFESRGGF
jgi:hypothetical protein